MLRLRTLLLTVLCSRAAQGNNCTSCDDTSSLRFHGLHLNMLANADGRSNIRTLVDAWMRMTGATMNVEFVSPEDMYTAATSDNANYYDVYTVDNRKLPEFAELGHAADITEEVKSAAASWTDVAKFVRDGLSQYANHVYGVPFDADTFQLYYRQDVFSNPSAFLPAGTSIPSDLRDPVQPSRLRVPSTWPEYSKIASLFRGVDINNDASADFGSCMPVQGSEAFYWIIAPLVSLVQHRQSVHGAFFELSDAGIAPLVENAAFAQVAEMWRSLHVDAGAGDDPSTFSWDSERAEKAFLNGQCLMFLSWPSTACRGSKMVSGKSEYVRGKIGVAPLPGWKSYFKKEANALEECNAGACPDAGRNGYPDGVNAASFMARGGMTGVVNKDRPKKSRQAALDLLMFLSSNLNVSSTCHYNAFRMSQLDAEPFIGAHWDDNDAEAFVAATRRTFKHPVQVMDMRTAEEGLRETHILYQQAFEDFLRGKRNISGSQSWLTAKISSLIQKVDEESGRERFFENVYRQSIGLPARHPIEPTDDYTGLEFLPYAMSGTFFVILVTAIVFRYSRKRMEPWIEAILGAEKNELSFDIFYCVLACILLLANTSAYMDIADRSDLKRYKIPFLLALIAGGISTWFSFMFAMYSLADTANTLSERRFTNHEDYMKVLRNVLKNAERKRQLGLAYTLLGLFQDFPVAALAFNIWREFGLTRSMQASFCITVASMGVKATTGKEFMTNRKMQAFLRPILDELEGKPPRENLGFVAGCCNRCLQWFSDIEWMFDEDDDAIKDNSGRYH